LAAIDHSWREEAECRDERVDVFFSSFGEGYAKGLCAACPVREACLSYALETGQEDGVWGGLNSLERRDLFRAATAGGRPLETVTYTTRARSTGAVCSAGRTEEGWGATCVTHGNHATARSRTDAETAVSHPQEWCPECAPIAAGLAPKETSRKG